MDMNPATSLTDSLKWSLWKNSPHTETLPLGLLPHSTWRHWRWVISATYKTGPNPAGAVQWEIHTVLGKRVSQFLHRKGKFSYIVERISQTKKKPVRQAASLNDTHLPVLSLLARLLKLSLLQHHHNKIYLIVTLLT